MTIRISLRMCISFPPSGRYFWLPEALAFSSQPPSFPVLSRARQPFPSIDTRAGRLTLVFLTRHGPHA